MKLLLKKGATDQTVYVFIRDSSSTTGAGLTGLAYNTASLVCYYVRALGSATALTLASQTVTGAHSDGGFVEVSSANMPGWYRLDLSDAIVASGAPLVGVHMKGATNMAPLPLEIQLVDFDPNDAAGLGLSRLDATVGSRATQASVDTIDDFLDTEIAAIKAKTDNLPALPAAIGSAMTLATDAMNANALAADAVAEIQSGLSTLDAASVRTAVGLASANLDTQLDAIPTAIENADALLKRDWTAVTGEAARSVLNALRFLRNKWSILASTLTVTKEDDSTTAWTGTVSSNPSADPIVGNDPS